jgi:hypothetical protein
MKLNQLIITWKGSTLFWILFLMNYYQNFSKTAYTYLVLHGSYGLLSVLKSFIFPDKAFVYKINLQEAIVCSLFLAVYWIFPLICIKNFVQLSNIELVVAQYSMIFGIFLHFGSDCQKYFVLETQKVY